MSSAGHKLFATLLRHRLKQCLSIFFVTITLKMFMDEILQNLDG